MKILEKQIEAQEASEVRESKMELGWIIAVAVYYNFDDDEISAKTIRGRTRWDLEEQAELMMPDKALSYELVLVQ